jgi:hypothetical protein
MVKKLLKEGIYDKQPVDGVVVYVDNKGIYALLNIDSVRYYLPLKLLNGGVAIGDVLTVERGENTRVSKVYSRQTNQTGGEQNA